MAEKKVKLELTQQEAELFYKELGKIRCWFDGFLQGRSGPNQAVAPGVLPPGVDTLRRIQIKLKEAK